MLLVGSHANSPAESLAEVGLESVEAADASQAIRLLREQSYAVLVCATGAAESAGEDALRCGEVLAARQVPAALLVAAEADVLERLRGALPAGISCEPLPAEISRSEQVLRIVAAARHVAEQALSNCRATHHRLWGQVPFGLMEFDRQGCLLAINARGAACWGEDAAGGLLGRSLESLVARQDREGVADWFQRAVAGERIETTCRCFVAGEPRMLHLTLLPPERELAAGQSARVTVISRDMTEQERAYEAVLRSEQRYRALFDNAPMAIFVTDLRRLRLWLDQLRRQGVEDLAAYLREHPAATREAYGLLHIKEVNSAALRDYGAESYEQLMADFPPHADDAFFEGFGQRLLALWNDEHLYQRDIGYRRLDGSELHLQMSVAVPRENDVYNYADTIIIQADITSRVLAERALRAGEESYRMLAENVSDLIAVFDDECRFLYASPSCRGLLGYPPAEMLGRRFDEYLTPEDAAELRQAHERIRRGEASRPILFRVRDRVGANRWVEARARLLPSQAGEPRERILAVIRDITERYEREANLHREHALLDGILRTSAAAIVVCDTEGKLLFANERADEVLCPPGSGKSVLDYRPEDWNLAAAVGCSLPPEECPFERVLREGEPLFGLELSIAPDGAPKKLVSINAAPLAGSEGTIFGIVYSIEEITQRRRAEQRLREREAEIALLTRASSLGELAAGIAHEINQPLYAIANYAGAARELLQQSSPPPGALMRYNEQIREQAIRAGSVIRRLNEFLQKKTPHYAPFSLDDSIRDTLEVVQAMAERCGVRVEYDPAENLPPLEGDQLLIEQVLVNLVHNAIEAVAEVRSVGGPSRPAVRVATRLDAGRREIEVAVADNGPGIAEDMLERVFTTYYTTKQRGMGMGLPISRSIIEGHGGRLWAERPQRPPAAGEPGAVGVVFRFTLPIRCGEELRARQAAARVSAADARSPSSPQPQQELARNESG